MSLASLPEYHLDYAQWDASEPESASSLAFVDALRRAMVGVGFFYLHNTPLDAAARRGGMFSTVERLFALPLERRLGIDMENSPHFQGYCKFGDERTMALQDHRDQIDYGPNRAPLKAVDGEDYRRLYGPNQYLDEEHQSVVDDWFEQATGVSDQLTSIIERALGVRPGRLSQFLKGELEGEEPLPYARMKAIRYPAGAQVDGISRVPGSAQGVGAHKDSGWLTLLSPSAVAGLQVQDFTGAWLDVPYVEGATIVNFGQQIENLSGGIIQAATHRVLSGETRYSVAFFSFPALNARLVPLDPETEFSEETLRLWREAQGREVVSDVRKGDLYASEKERFGWIAWRGLVRSHPGVVRRFYPELLEGV